MSLVVATGRHKGHPWRIVKDGSRFRGQWFCGFQRGPGSLAKVCGRWYGTQAGAKTDVLRRIEASPVTEVEAGGRFNLWRWPAYAERRNRNPDHLCALPLPPPVTFSNSAFAISRKRKYRIATVEDGQVVPSVPHARAAKTRAAKAYEAGKLSAYEKRMVDAAADKVLKRRGQRSENPREDFAADWHVGRRAPVQLSDAWLPDYGDALELETPGHVIRWRGVRFLWHPRARAIVVLQGATKGRPVPNASAPAKVTREWRKFMHRAPQVERRDTMPAIPDVWRSTSARRFDYRSDKFDRKTREYTHPLGKAVRVYRGGGSKPPWVWVIKGGNLRITSRGIEG